MKARLVALGFEEEEDLSTLCKDSPTCGKETMQIFFAIAVSMKWQVDSIDIRAAFLQGKQINRNVFIKPPKVTGSVMLWKLNKAVYVLTDAPRKWYSKVNEELNATGCTICKYDEALFFQKFNGELHGMIYCHVDYFC